MSRQWVNVDSLTARDLKDKVVVVQFWTFQSTPCMASIPTLRKLRTLVPADEVVIVGVHSPESDREKERVHFEDAIRNLDVDYPVAVDNDRAIWRAFKCRQWPTTFVVDRQGIVRHVAAGELLVGTRRWDTLLEALDRLRKEGPDSVVVR